MFEVNDTSREDERVSRVKWDDAVRLRNDDSSHDRSVRFAMITQERCTDRWLVPER